ncbi:MULTISPECIES: RidA family protein [unclassified Paenibacillus]|uniref:RidA family protein n=1 Tax=unclassified Paenibacillus TaxID=185978 RepID=UPI001FD76420|nr:MULTISPECIES: RidA family protein [unclassified Paenibacillus]
MARRKSIEIQGVTHGNAPIPMASQIDKIVYSSAIMGKDSATNALPVHIPKEMECLFQNVGALMKAAGGTTDDIVKMSVYLKNNDLRAPFNEEWLKMFPHENDRPARHITLVDLPNHMNVQVEIVAVLA